MHVPTVVAVACVAYAVSIILHEAAHAVTGWWVGGQPKLVSSTDVRGDWSNVSRAGIFAIGISGSLVNWAMAGAATWLGVKLKGLPASTRWLLWLLLSINGFIPSLYMIVSPLLGFGDWHTVLSQWPDSIVWRAVIALCGVALTWCWVRVTANRLAALIGADDELRVDSLVSRLVITSWLTGGVLALLAALASPLGILWAVGIALGSTLGSTWPLLLVADVAVSKNESHASGCITRIEAHRGWLAAGAVIAALFVGVFGPGVRLG